MWIAFVMSHEVHVSYWWPCKMSLPFFWLLRIPYFHCTLTFLMFLLNAESKVIFFLYNFFHCMLCVQDEYHIHSSPYRYSLFFFWLFIMSQQWCHLFLSLSWIQLVPQAILFLHRVLNCIECSFASSYCHIKEFSLYIPTGFHWLCKL